MVKCLICSLEKKFSIVEHLRSTHGLSTKEYRSQFENAEVKSLELKEMVSNNNRNAWANPDYHKKMCESRQVTHRTEEFRKKQSAIISSVYANGHKSWNDGLTKHDDERISAVGKRNSELLSGRSKETHAYLEVHSSFMKENASDEFRFRSSWTKERKAEWKQKISESVSDAVLEGRCSSSNRYKKGWYLTKTGSREFYDSSWELELMMFLDTTTLSWTKSHGHKISYINENNETRRYVPDFYICDDYKKCILELKGFSINANEIERKRLAAETFALKLNASYFLSFSVDEAKKHIVDFFGEKNEVCKNQE